MMNLALSKQRAVAVEVSPLKANPQQTFSKIEKETRSDGWVTPELLGGQIIMLSSAHVHYLPLNTVSMERY